MNQFPAIGIVFSKRRGSKFGNLKAPSPLHSKHIGHICSWNKIQSINRFDVVDPVFSHLQNYQPP